MLTFVIPTRRRVNKQLSIQFIPLVMRKEVFIVCPEDEMEAHRRNWPFAEIVKTPDHIQNISDKRQWILENIPAKKMIMLDDDLRFYARVNQQDPSDVRLRTPEWNGNDPVIIDYLNQLHDRLDYYAHAGFSARGGNNGITDAFWRDNKRMMYFLGYNMDVVKDYKINRFRCREDFDLNLQLLRDGYKNSVAYGVCAGQPTYGSPGGCEDERTVELSNSEAERFAAMHHPFVKTKHKDYKQSISRVEVICYWEKAWKASGKDLSPVGLARS